MRTDSPNARPLLETASGGQSSNLVPGAQEASWRKYIARCAKGDTTFLARLYDESSRLVYSLILKIVGNAEEAKEVTLEVYTQVWKGARIYDESRGTATAWLIKLARSRAIDRIRSRSVCQRPDVSTPEEQGLACHEASLEAQAEACERRAHVQAALRGLRPEHREAILAAYFLGLTRTQQAERLQQTSSAARVGNREAVIELRKRLAPLAV